MTRTRRSHQESNRVPSPEEHISSPTTRPSADKIETSGVQQAYENSDAWWRSSAEAAIKQLAASGVEFDSFTLSEMGVPEPDHFRRWGAVMAAARNRGLIEPLGYRRSRRPGGAPGVCRTWRGVVKAGDRR